MWSRLSEILVYDEGPQACDSGVCEMRSAATTYSVAVPPVLLPLRGSARSVHVSLIRGPMHYVTHYSSPQLVQALTFARGGVLDVLEIFAGCAASRPDACQYMD